MPPPISISIELPTQWRALKGMGYGLRQPVMLGNLSVRAEGAAADRADRWFEQALGEGLPPGLAADHSPAAIAERLLHWCLAVQRWCRLPVFDAGRVLATHPERPTEFLVALPYASAHAVPEALQWVAQRWALAASAGDAEPLPEIGLDGILAALRRHQVCVTNDYWLQAAALASDIPVGSVVPGTFSYGLGRHARWMASALSDRTPHLAYKFADKRYTALLLRRQGLPGAEHLQVDSADAAVAAALRLGYPVVVKPADRSQGIGVSVFLRSEAEVRKAFAHARAASDQVLVERHVEGHDARLTVCQGQVLKVVERVPASVVGDGRSTVGELVARRLQDADIQRRSREYGRPVLVLDDEALDLVAQQGLSVDAVAPEGQRVYLRRLANVATGGSTVPVPPEDIHPDNLRLAIQAAQALRLDLAGVDLLLPDRRRSWLETGGSVCEVNVQPAVGETNMREAYAEILRRVVGPVSRVPVLLLLGSAAEARPTFQWLQGRARGGDKLLLSSTEGLWENHDRIGGPQASGFDAAAAALAHPAASAVVCAMSPEELLSWGLPVDRFDAALILRQDAASARRLPELWPLLFLHVRRWLAMPQVPVSDWPSPAHLRHVGAALHPSPSPEAAWQQLRSLLHGR